MRRILRSVRLQYFRCFREATVRLEPLTALVGPNASGKTSLLEAIAGSDFRAVDVLTRDPHREGRVKKSFEPQGELVHIFGAGAQKTQRKGDVNHHGQVIHLDVNAMRTQQAPSEEHQLDSTGSNLVNVVATLPRRTQEMLSRRLCDLVPVLQDVDVRPGRHGKQRLVFNDRWASHVWYEPEQVSDGTLFVLGLLVLEYQTSPTTVICIEEPEHGLHPYLLGELVSIFRRVAGDDAREIQIVLATQSADLLEHLKPEEVRFLSRNPDTGSVDIEEAPTETSDWRDAYEMHQQSLGSLWLSGGLGGVPGS